MGILAKGTLEGVQVRRAYLSRSDLERVAYQRANDVSMFQAQQNNLFAFHTPICLENNGRFGNELPSVDGVLVVVATKRQLFQSVPDILRQILANFWGLSFGDYNCCDWYQNNGG